jgi:AcrR family transcriptional regulator
MAAGSGGEAATRDRVIDAALSLFSARGTTAVSMRELADAAGVTVPGVYYHFASKADLIRAVYRDRVDRDPWVPPEPAPVQQLVVEQASRELSRFLDDYDFLRLMHHEASLGDPDAREVGASLDVEWRARWHETLLLGTDLAPDADIDAATDVLTTFLWGLFIEHLRRPAQPIDRRIRDLARVIGPALTSTPARSSSRRAQRR